jgi:hypothetical protein
MQPSFLCLAFTPVAAGCMGGWLPVIMGGGGIGMTGGGGGTGWGGGGGAPGIERGDGGTTMLGPGG